MSEKYIMSYYLIHLHINVFTNLILIYLLIYGLVNSHSLVNSFQINRYAPQYMFFFSWEKTQDHKIPNYNSMYSKGILEVHNLTVYSV